MSTDVLAAVENSEEVEDIDLSDSSFGEDSEEDDKQSSDEVDMAEDDKQEDEEPLIKMMKKKVEPIKCEHCGKSFKHKCYLAYHEKIHIRECFMLPFFHVFGIRTSKSPHKFSANAERFECDQCGKKFLHKNQLTFHQKRHLREYFLLFLVLG